MLQLITSQEASADRGDVLGMIYGGTARTTKTWSEKAGLLITEVSGEPFIRYFQLTICNNICAEGVTELTRLAGELGKNLPDCVVERERVSEPHPWYPGSKYFDLVMVYGG